MPAETNGLQPLLGTGRPAPSTWLNASPLLGAACALVGCAGIWSLRCCCCEAAHMAAQRIHNDVQDYYGKEVKKTKDLKTTACLTTARSLPAFVREALECVHEEVTEKYYGCGLVIPECLENCWILDLGSGSGRDCYMLSKLVGENGHATGIDMTEAQVEVAKKYIDYHMNKFNYQNSNVNFILGYIEDLGTVGLKDESYDLVISNCVVNLSPNKRAVLREAYRVLKTGGEMYFSDVYASHDLPQEIRKHRILWGECLGGALWWEDLYKIAEDVGFCPPRLVTVSQITINNKELENIVGDCQFVSATFRLFKISQHESTQRCEVIYNGGIFGHERELEFDVNYKFKQGAMVEVDKDTAAILQNSRFATKFLIHPVGQKLPVPEGCSPVKVKDKIRDPFKVVEQIEARVPAQTVSGCCGSKGCC